MVGGLIVRAKREFEAPPAWGRRDERQGAFLPRSAGRRTIGRAARFDHAASAGRAEPGRADLPRRFGRRGGPPERWPNRAAVGASLRDPSSPAPVSGGDPRTVRRWQDLRLETSHAND